jgi:hypothetical protein
MMQLLIRVVMLGCLAAIGSLHALTVEDEKQPAQSTETTAEESSPPAKQSPRPRAKPATTFKPSEKIGADSAVSFPVDI